MWLTELNSLSSIVMQTISTYILLVHYEWSIKTAPQRSFVLTIMECIDNLFVLLVIISKDIFKIIKQTHIRIILNILISCKCSLIVGSTTTHLLSTPQVNLALEHLRCSKWPISTTIGELIVIVISGFWSQDVCLNLLHYVSSSILLTGNLTQDDSFSFRML